MRILISKNELLAVFVVCLLALMFPNTTHAAWWNPLTWFTEDISTTKTINLPKEDDNADSEASTTKSSDTVDEKEDVPQNTQETEQTLQVEPRVKEIIVSDPAQKARIDSLIEENAVLRKEIENLKAKLTELLAENEESSVEIIETDYKTEVSPVIDRLEILRDEKEELTTDLDEDNCNEDYRTQDVPKCSDIVEEIDKLENEEIKLLEEIEILKLRYGVS